MRCADDDVAAWTLTFTRSPVRRPYSSFRACDEMWIDTFARVSNAPLWWTYLRSRHLVESVDRPGMDQWRRSLLPAGAPAQVALGTHAEHAAIRLSAAGLRQDTTLVY